MQMDSRINLCGRSDFEPDRYFSGSLSNLMLFDSALTNQEIQALYAAYTRQSVEHPIGLPPNNDR